MTKAAALHQFFSRFMPAYASDSVPENAVLPYLTYTPVFSAFEEGEVNLTVNCWFYTESEEVPNAKVEEISKAIGRGGVTLRCDDGFIWLKRGSPFAQRIEEQTDKNLKRRYINIDAEFFTTN